jgi:hypothetical protein
MKIFHQIEDKMMKKKIEAKKVSPPKVRGPEKGTAADGSQVMYFTRDEFFEILKGYVLGKPPKPLMAKPETAKSEKL